MTNFRAFTDSVRDEAAQWCRGKNWLIRLPLLGWFAHVLVKSLEDPSYQSILAGLNLGLHELGHLVFSFFGTFLNVLGGTLLEFLAPFLGMINFYRQKDFFAVALCFGWLATALFDIARYAADARAMSLPLVTPFGADPVVAHD